MIGSQTNSRYKADFVLDITFQTKNQDNKKFWIAYKLRYKKRPILSSLPLPNEYRHNKNHPDLNQTPDNKLSPDFSLPQNKRRDTTQIVGQSWRFNTVILHASIQNKQYIYFSRTTEQPVFSYTVINQSWFQLALMPTLGLTTVIFLPRDRFLFFFPFFLVVAHRTASSARFTCSSSPQRHIA
jgi:hypothetical protein